MKSLNEIIGQAKLTKVGTIIARYILDHTTEACFMTSTELADTLDVSEASIIRFSRSIGFSGYMDFQKYLHKYYLNTLTKSPDPISDPTKHFAESKENHSPEVYFGMEELKLADTNLKSIFSLNEKELFNQTLQTILNAENIYIFSCPSNTDLGNRLYYLLKLVLPNVYTAGINPGTAIDHLCDISENDCLISICLPHYSKSDLSALYFANDMKAKNIVITDLYNKHLPILKELADIVLRVDIGNGAFFPVLTGAFFLIELLADSISRKVDDHKVTERLERIERYTSYI